MGGGVEEADKRKSLRAVVEGSEGEERGKTERGEKRLGVAVKTTEAPQEFGNQ